jgi:hypothetical protein
MRLVKLLAGVLALVLAAMGPAAAQDCPSKVTLKVNSIGYSGQFTVELRSGTRPGSEVEDTVEMSSGGQHTFDDVCPGTYFFAIGPAASEEVSVTSYFEVTFDGRTYNNPVITVFYTTSAGSGQTVGRARKSEL